MKNILIINGHPDKESFCFERVEIENFCAFSSFPL